MRGKDPFHRRRCRRGGRRKWRCHQRWRRRSIRAAAHNQRHHQGSLTRTRRALRTMGVDVLPGTPIDVSPHEACDTEGITPMPSSRVMAACAAGGNNCCRMGWRSSPSGPGAIRGDSGPKRSGRCWRDGWISIAVALTRPRARRSTGPCRDRDVSSADWDRVRRCDAHRLWPWGGTPLGPNHQSPHYAGWCPAP